MKTVKLNPKIELKLKNIVGFFKKKVTPFGTGAKVDIPKQYLNKTVYIVVCDEK